MHGTCAEPYPAADYPYVLLSNAGVDLAQPEPYRAVVAKMNSIMDEMESILEGQK